MLESKLKYHLEDRFDLQIKSSKALSGGDINAVFLLEDQDQKYVAKINGVDKFPEMFMKEANGLTALREKKTIDIPEVLGYGDFDQNTYLLIEYRESGKPSKEFWDLFGRQMAALHTNTRDTFGFTEDNYYGSLPQYNDACDTAVDFFISQRLEPQFRMAAENGYDFKNLDTFYQKVENLIPDEEPALIHGDLWSGNYLINSDNEPCLVDPAVAYAPREMDLAMMQLFGGFNDRLFSAYDEAFPLEKDWKERIKLWQLYYVLGHVNLFGGSYYNSAKGIISKYS